MCCRRLSSRGDFTRGGRDLASWWSLQFDHHVGESLVVLGGTRQLSRRMAGGGYVSVTWASADRQPPTANRIPCDIVVIQRRRRRAINHCRRRYHSYCSLPPNNRLLTIFLGSLPHHHTLLQIPRIPANPDHRNIVSALGCSLRPSTEKARHGVRPRPAWPP
jgi:hypothetical protein